MSWAPKSRTPPPGYAYGPAYRPSLPSIVRAVVYIARGRARSLAHDALYAIADMPVPPLARGGDALEPPLIVVANHYERPGLWMAWPAIFLAHLLSERTGSDLHWVAIQEWESFSLWGIPVPPSLTRAVFERAFYTYGILAMPVPSAPAAERAAAMRGAARMVRASGIVGVMPEGEVGYTPELLEARPGVGTFLHLLGAPVLPVGLYEEEGRLVAHIGEPFRLEPPRGLSREETDASIRRTVMTAIRDLLPPALWGVYREG